MSELQGKNLTLYLGDAMKTVGCEASCTLAIINELIDVTSKGSGRGTNREYGRSDWSIQSNGVVFVNAAFDGSGANLDPFEFAAYSLEGKKVSVKLQTYDGSTTKWMVGIGLIESCEYSGEAEGFALYNTTIRADGLLYTSQNLISNPDYDGPSVIIYTSGGTTDGFSESALENASTVYFIHRSGNGANLTYQTSEIQTLANAVDLPTGIGTVGFHAGTGTVNFEAGLGSNDIVFVSYDNPD